MQLERFYSYIGLPSFVGHDFNHVEQITVEDDEVYGVFGDHQIRGKVEPHTSQAIEIFGPGLCDWIRQRYGWFYEKFGLGRLR